MMGNHPVNSNYCILNVRWFSLHLQFMEVTSYCTVMDALVDKDKDNDNDKECSLAQRNLCCT